MSDHGKKLLDDLRALVKELAKISTTGNTNYNPTIDGARVEACELIIKHSGEEKPARAALAVLNEISTSGGVLPQHRVRAMRVLLENRTTSGVLAKADAEVKP